MKKNFLTVISAFFALTFLFNVSVQAQVKPIKEGNLLVYRVGDVHSMADINTYNACPIYLDEYDVSGDKAALVQSIAMPPKTVGENKRLVAPGKAILEGWISLSDDKKFVVVPGYDALLGTNILNPKAATTNRVIALVDANGTINSSFAANNPYDANSYRSAATIDGSAVWTAGGGLAGNGGIFHLVAGSNEATHIGGASVRQLKFYGGDLYANDGARIYQIDGKNAAKPLTKFRNITGDDLFKNGTAFAIVELEGAAGVEKVLYVGTYSTGVLKYSLVKNKWVKNGSYEGIDGLTGVEARVVNGKVELFLISSRSVSGGGDAVLYKVLDEAGHGENIDLAVPKTILNAEKGTTFRNAVWAPIK